MSNGFISYRNWVDGATLTSDSEVSGNGVTNLADPVVKITWVAAAATAYFQADFGQDRAVDLLAFRIPRDGLLIGASDQVTHKLDPASGTAGAGAALDVTVDSDVLANYGYHAYLPPATVTARYWRCSIAATSLGVGCRIGRAWAGAKDLQPGLNFLYGWQRAQIDPSLISQGQRSLVEYADEVTDRQRTLTVGFDGLTAAEADAAEDIDYYAGLSKQVLLVRDPDADPLSREVIIGRFAQPSPIAQPDFASFSKTWTVRESL